MGSLAGLSGGIEVISTIIYKINSLIMALLMLTGGITSPSQDDRIRTLDETEMMFVAWGDPQICNYNPEREANYTAAVDDLGLALSKIDALTIVGDIAENGFESEYNSVADDLIDLGDKIQNYVMVTGNHDIRLREYEQSTERFYNFANSLNSEENAMTNIYYTYEVNGYTFIVMGSDEMRFEDAYISDAQLTWLDETLASVTADGKPAFVLCHYPLKDTHGLPNTWGTSLWESGSIGEQTEQVFEILNRYNNVFFITGHLHTSIGQYTYEELGNVHGINVPSIGIDSKDGDYNIAGCGVIFEVYEDKVVARARDFVNGVYFPDYQITYELV